MISYYRHMTFLGDHNSSFSVFGEDLVLFVSTLSKISTKDVRGKLDEYADKYV